MFGRLTDRVSTRRVELITAGLDLCLHRNQTRQPHRNRKLGQLSDWGTVLVSAVHERKL